MGNSCRKILAFLMSFALLFSITAIPAVADDSENRTVTLGFENVEWHTEDNETYCSADITASLSTDDVTFDAMIIQFNVVYNAVPGVLAFDAVTASDTIEKVTSGTGRNQKTSTMAVDSIDAETADSLGYASVLMHGDNGVRHPIKNGQVIATAYFLLADESMKSSESQLSFSKGVINYIDDSNAIQNYSVNTSATVNVPALVPSIKVQALNTVTLNPAEITAGKDEQTVQASAMDKDNKPVTAGIVWSLDRTEGVSVSDTGVITVTSAASGNYVVTASPAEGSETVTGTAQVTLKVNPLPVVQELNTVTLNPSEITAGQNEQSVQASAMDKDNKPVTAGIVWSLDRTEGININSAGVITVTSSASGNYVVTASPADGSETVTGTAQATLKVNPFNEGYAVVVTGGSVQNPSQNGKYAENTQVTIKASSGSFSYWTGLDNITFVSGDDNTATVTFYMPNRDVNAVAHDGGGCYVATAVYGSYDCPEVWTLRRFRDEVLAQTWYGRLFIRLYYAVSPTAVKLFGGCEWFQNFFRERLDKMVSGLQADGFESTPYQDRAW